MKLVLIKIICSWKATDKKHCNNVISDNSPAAVLLPCSLTASCGPESAPCRTEASFAWGPEAAQRWCLEAEAPAMSSTRGRVRGEIKTMLKRVPQQPGNKICVKAKPKEQLSRRHSDFPQFIADLKGPDRCARKAAPQPAIAPRERAGSTRGLSRMYRNKTRTFPAQAQPWPGLADPAARSACEPVGTAAAVRGAAADELCSAPAQR